MFLGLTLRSQTPSIQLSLSPVNRSGQRFLESPAATNRVHFLQQSSNLVDWTELAVVHHGGIRYPVGNTGDSVQRYFRASSRARTSADDWKNQIQVPDDPFSNEPPDHFSLEPRPRWIKFLFFPNEPEPRVYFQDSAKYVFHHDFARVRLAPFRGSTRADFDRQTLYRSNQVAVLGAILLPGDSVVPEFGIQFVGQDKYTPDEVTRWFEWVRSVVSSGHQGENAFYIPTLEQAPGTEHIRRLRDIGTEVASVNRWLTGDVCYSVGWALGRIKFIPGNEIAAAYLDGRLKSTDILITDGIPAEVPPLAGLIAMNPATPNSHVVILARSYGIPFIYPANPADRLALRALDGREIVLRVGGEYRCQYKVVDVEGNLAADVRAELVARKTPDPLDFPAKESPGIWSTNVAALQISDSRHFGGKASRLGLLGRLLPTNSPSPAIALSFDLWDRFMAQPWTNDVSANEAIRQMLQNHSYPPDVRTLSQDLAGIRTRIRRDLRFSTADQQAILEILQSAGFSTNRNIRFRSSTNLEDGDQFTGAGLYDSYSGCMADDLDDDTRGPSRCDDSETDERGVFRAIQRVYASFYNDNAVIERLRFRVDESKAGMAVLVHPSYPDADELANGVATISVTRQGQFRSYAIHLVTQLGAVSVTNPDGAAVPEEVDGYLFSPGETDATAAFRRSSSLVPLGSKVMNWESDYRALNRMLVRVIDAHPKPSGDGEFILDFEYKKLRGGQLELKQVRPVPVPDRSKKETVILLNEPLELELFQGEFGTVFSNHRLKSLWRIESPTRVLTPQGLRSSFVSNARVEYLRETQRIRLESGPASWPGYSYVLDNEYSSDRWVDGTGESRRDMALQTQYQATAQPPQSVIATHDDFSHDFTVKYATPQPHVTWEGFGTISEETVRLVRKGSIIPAGEPRVFTVQQGRIKLETSLYWPEPPKGPSAGYTAPLAAWKETRITGLTAQPVVLKGWWSQTYRPGHHNFSNEFIFEPGLEEGISDAQLEELRNVNVKFIYVNHGDFQNEMYLFGNDGKGRKP